MPPEILSDVIKQSSENSTEGLNLLIEEFQKSYPDFKNFVADKITAEGNTIEAIEKTVEEGKFDLIIMGTKGASGLEEVLIGSNAYSVLSKSKIPVLVIPQKSEYKGFDNILYPIDLTCSEVPAVNQIQNIVDLKKSDLTFLHLSGELEEDLTNDEKKCFDELKEKLSDTSLLITSSCLFAQGVPHYMTEAEQELLRTYHFPTNNLRENNPPPTAVRTMAEWEECQGIVIKWMSFTPILTEIVRYACQEGLVFVLCSDSTTVKSALVSASIPTNNIRYLKAVNSGSQNSIWARDYGPWAAYSGVADSLKLIDWIYNRPRPGDDTNSVTIGQFLNVPVYRTLTSPDDLVNTGGNFMVDGNGTAFASRLILSENAAGNSYGVSAKNEAQINSIMNRYMGIGLNRYIKMDILPYDQIHHIDMHIKLIDEETLLVSQYPAGIADGPQIETNIQYIQNNFVTSYGKPYKIVRIPAPPAANGTYPNNGGDYRTYTNSLIINKTVLVPIYASSYDTTALRIYRESMPGYKVYGINCNTIIPSLGAIHCITKEIGVYEPVFISHSAIRDNQLTTTQQIKAYIKTKSGVSSAKVYWTNDTLSGFSQIPMTPSAGDTFTANIPKK
ncbi:unnamed protein product [Rotaria sp. Silwood1]|nr:unnamed protein product [Rotaria sp. Silwood1]